MTARCHPVSLPGDTEDKDTRDRIRIRIRPGKTLKFHFPEGFRVSPTSTTDLEPLGGHGAPPAGAADPTALLSAISNNSLLYGAEVGRVSQHHITEALVY